MKIFNNNNFSIYIYKMSKSFDFVVKAKQVIIKNKCHNKYQVELAGVGDFLKYQTWSSTNTNNVNGKRNVSLVNAKIGLNILK
jgi:hypothetical protein